MKRIVNGKRYDTDKADLVAEASHGTPGDFSFYEESLYHTRRGAWFVYGEGGPSSPYSQQVGSGSRGAGSAVVPLEDTEAMRWLEKEGYTSDLEEWFGSQIEDA